MDKPLENFYGNRLRVRTCGLCWRGDDLLLINHRGLYPHDFWAPPGGGVEFGEATDAALVREFGEETGLTVVVENFLFACEFIKPPFHAIELFFEVRPTGGNPIMGLDPEVTGGKQIIRDVRYASNADLQKIPFSEKHGLFKIAQNAEKIRGLRGYLKI